MTNINHYKLTPDVTVGQLLLWMDEKSPGSKTEVIGHRFKNRYLKDAETAES